MASGYIGFGYLNGLLSVWLLKAIVSAGCPSAFVYASVALSDPSAWVETSTVTV